MQIFIQSDPAEKQLEALLIPLRQDDQLAANLTDIANMAGCPADTLLADFKAEAKEVLPIFSTDPANPNRIFLLGLGKDLKSGETIATARHFFHKYKPKLPATLAVELRQFVDNQQVAMLVEGISNGLELGLYDISLYKTEDKKPINLLTPGAEAHFFVGENAVAEAEKSARKGKFLGETQKQVFDLLNAPGNKKRPIDLANWATGSGKKHGFSTRILLKEECETEGLHALLSVNAGSPNPPAFIIMEYIFNDERGMMNDESAPDPSFIIHHSPLKKVGLVGKGITFDTGGISIKPSENMHLMKSDMGGAAAVFGAMEMAAKLRLPIHLIGIVPSSENMVDGRATKPGDVVGSYSGKTIEVIDTDAEGRIVLADGLNYMVKNFAPETVIDLATLTGSIVRTLGSNAAGLFSQNDDLCEKLTRAGEETGERLWRLPMWESFADTIKSDVADVKNFSGRPVHDAINAAKFLEVFTEKHTSWAHLDIAGVAFAAGDFSLERSATGFGVRLLTAFLEDLAETRKVRG